MSFVAQKDLVPIMRSAKVHVLASWFETTGLVSLEAAYCGCNIVTSRRGDQEEYFRHIAWFCEPGEPKSIRSAISEAYAAERNARHPQEFIEENYTWASAAKATLDGYNKALSMKAAPASEREGKQAVLPLTPKRDRSKL